MEHLPLKRSIVFLDLETTGLNSRTDRIVEISVIKYNPDETYEERTVRVNPDIPIPPGASAVHGITNEDVANEPQFKQYAKSFLDFLDGCDISGYNAMRFDIPLLQKEFERAGLEFSIEDRYVVDPMIIFHMKEPRDLSSAYQKYCGQVLEGAHSALADARAVKDIILGQMKYYPDIGNSIEELHNFCHPTNPDWIDSTGRLIRTEAGPIFGFGKYNGQLVSEVATTDSDYLNWMLTGDFDQVIKNAINEHIQM